MVGYRRIAPKGTTASDTGRSRGEFKYEKHNDPGNAPERTTRVVVRGGSQLENDSMRGAGRM